MTKPQRIPRTERDEGTPELRMKRFTVVQGGDPNMAFCELGRLCERGILDQDMPTARRMFDAGMTVAAIWAAVFPTKGASTLGQFQPGHSGEFDVDKADADRKSLIKFFGPKRSMMLNAVIDCVFHDERQEGGKLQKLRRGLHLVIDWQKAERA